MHVYEAFNFFGDFHIQTLWKSWQVNLGVEDDSLHSYSATDNNDGDDSVVGIDVLHGHCHSDTETSQNKYRVDAHADLTRVVQRLQLYLQSTLNTLNIMTRGFG